MWEDFNRKLLYDEPKYLKTKNTVPNCLLSPLKTDTKLYISRVDALVFQFCVQLSDNGVTTAVICSAI